MTDYTYYDKVYNLVVALENLRDEIRRTYADRATPQQWAADELLEDAAAACRGASHELEQLAKLDA